MTRDMAGPVAVIALVLGSALLSGDVWLALVYVSGAADGSWTGPEWTPLLWLQVAVRWSTEGPPPDLDVPVFLSILIASVLLEIAAAVILALRFQPAGGRDRGLLRRRGLGDLSGRAADRRARSLRGLSSTDPVADTDRGIRLLDVGGRDVWMSWEDVALVIMGPRSNKTSAIAVPTVLSAPGLVVATSNKADLWSLTTGLRAEVGPVWTFDPQQIAHARQTWWWDPLRAIREADDAHRYEAAARLAGHFMGTIGGQRRDPFFHAAGEQVLVGTLLAAALSGGSLREVLHWLQYGRRDAISALDRAGAGVEAADLEASLAGADVTTKGIFQTARTATKSLTSERILRWVTPPHTWRQPGEGTYTELDPWDLVIDGEQQPVTAHLLSKEGAATAAPVVAALVDRILEIAELRAQAAGGRLEPPVVAVLDEAANICPIQALPQLYSHYGSRGIQVLTMLQSYQQGVGVWGNQGMDALWSAATIKLVGAGVDDHAFLQKVAGLIGDHEVRKVSTTHSRGSGVSRQVSHARQPLMPPDVLRALDRDHAVLFSTGRRPALGRLRPWYREQIGRDIRTYADQALHELRDAAARTLPTRKEQS
jgi:type IV secretion system protein VirD4